MPKISVQGCDTRPDEAVARDRAIKDLMYIENSNMYINQKKQIQSLIYKLYELDFYIDNDTIINV